MADAREARHSDGLKVNTDFQITSELKFDGKDYPAVGPSVPPA